MEIHQYFEPMPRLAEMHKNIIEMIDHHKRGRKTIDLHVNQWSTPFGLLPLAVMAENLGMDITYGRNTSNVKGYLRSIKFPTGVSRLNPLTKTLNYLPLSRLHIDTGDTYLTRYEDRILRDIKDEEIKSSFQNALKYLTSEMVTNIKEHARVEDYWILAQYWAKTDTCEIAIADTGIGYLKSYLNTSYEVQSHEEAIKNAIQGNSSKDDVERGTGIPGMINIFCEGYKGCVVIMSGDKLLFKEKGKNDFYKLDFDWSGVFIGIRFKLSLIHALAYLGS